MAFKVVHSENYDLKQEMNELLHYHQKKMLYIETKDAGKSQRSWAIYSLPYYDKSEGILT